MKRDIKKNKRNIKWITVVAIICLIILIVLGIKLASNKDTEIHTEKNIEIKMEQQEEVRSTLEEMLEEDGSMIECPEVNLYYPEKWKNQMRVEQVEGDIHTVQFFGTVKGKNEVHIFDIVFGETEGILLGTLNEKEIYLVYADPVLDESWTEDEKNEIYAMQEDANYIIGMLEKEEGFNPAF